MLAKFDDNNELILTKNTFTLQLFKAKTINEEDARDFLLSAIYKTEENEVLGLTGEFAPQVDSSAADTLIDAVSVTDSSFIPTEWVELLKTGEYFLFVTWNME